MNTPAIPKTVTEDTKTCILVSLSLIEDIQFPDGADMHITLSIKQSQHAQLLMNPSNSPWPFRPAKCYTDCCLWQRGTASSLPETCGGGKVLLLYLSRLSAVQTPSWKWQVSCVGVTSFNRHTAVHTGERWVTLLTLGNALSAHSMRTTPLQHIFNLSLLLILKTETTVISLLC